MTRLSSLPLRLTALLGSAVIIASACGGATPSASVAPPSAGGASEAPQSSAPFTPVSYPEDGSSACGTEGYSGQIGSIKATAANSVEFTLCAPDAAFLSKVAFTSLAIQDFGLPPGDRWRWRGPVPQSERHRSLQAEGLDVRLGHRARDARGVLG